jgi:type IV pilus assembly protein PilB
MADSILAESPGHLTGVARVLVNAGKLDSVEADALAKTAKEQKSSFVHAVVSSGKLSASALAQTLSKALSVPVVDLSAIDVQRLPKGIIDNKLSSQYQVLALSKRGNRLFVAASDPTNQEAVERIKFATQLNPEWIIVEHDKLLKMLEGSTASAQEQLAALAS